MKTECSPNCLPATVTHVKTLYLASDIALGVGVAALAAAFWTHMREPPRRGEGNRGSPAGRRRADDLGWICIRFGDVLTMRRFAGNQEMENKKMTMYRAPLALLLGSFAMFGCWQKLDEQRLDGIIPVNVNAGGGIGAKFPVETTTPEIGETALDNGDPNSDRDHRLRQGRVRRSGDAVDASAMAATGAERSATWRGSIRHQASLIGIEASSKYPGWKYIVAGDPGKLAHLSPHRGRQDMPPPSTRRQPAPAPDHQ